MKKIRLIISASFLLLIFLTIGQAVVAETSDESSLIGKKAPEISLGQWLNSDPLTLSQLRGKVVLVEFWAFECENCRNTLPYIKSWYRKFDTKNFQIIGVHTPEFDAEKSFKNLSAETKKLGIKYAVVTDNDSKTWDAYDQEYWPTLYLIDKNGIIRYVHIGEGNYKETENEIRKLLEE
jgi:peroxiredoxin